MHHGVYYCAVGTLGVLLGHASQTKDHACMWFIMFAYAWPNVEDNHCTCIMAYIIVLYPPPPPPPPPPHTHTHTHKEQLFTQKQQA